MNIDELKQSLLAFNRKHGKSHSAGFVPFGDLDRESAAMVLKTNYSVEVSLRGMDVKSVSEQNFNRVLDWATGRSRRWLLLMGKTGTGKSTFLNAIRRSAYFVHGDEVSRRHITICTEKASNLGRMLKNHTDGFDSMRSATLLMLDDVGFAGDGEMVNNYGIVENPVATILESRYDSQLSTLLTTNLDGDQLRQMYGERIYSRMLEMCDVATFNGRDYRAELNKGNRETNKQ